MHKLLKSAIHPLTNRLHLKSHLQNLKITTEWIFQPWCHMKYLKKK